MGLGFDVYSRFNSCLGFELEGFKIQSLFRVQGSGLNWRGVALRLQGFSGLEFRVNGLACLLRLKCPNCISCGI